MAEENALARREAHEIQQAHPHVFYRTPVPIWDLAQALGIRVEKRSGLGGRARLEFFNQDDRYAVVAVEAGLDYNVSRFAVAHEIGHAILLWKHPTAAARWEIGKRETFASTFATEILVPSQLRLELASSFRVLTDPIALLRLASKLGISPHALLTLATRENSWVEKSNRVWMRLKHVENAVTQRDPKLRIVSVHYSRDEFFVPSNQSFSRFAGDDTWLRSLPEATLIRHRSQIVLSRKRPEPLRPKFVLQHLLADLSAVKLHHTADPGSYFIVLADFAGSELPSA